MNPQSSSSARKVRRKPASTKKSATTSVLPKVKKAGKKAKKSVVAERRKVYEALNYSVNSEGDKREEDVLDGSSKKSKGGLGANLRKTLNKTKSQISMISLQVQQQGSNNGHERLVDETPSPSPVKRTLTSKRPPSVPVAHDLLDVSSATEAVEGNPDFDKGDDVAMEEVNSEEVKSSSFFRRTVQRIWSSSDTNYDNLDTKDPQRPEKGTNKDANTSSSCVVS